MKSFRLRLLFFSLLWTAGLLAIASVVGMAVLHAHPRWGGTVHYIMLSILAVTFIVAAVSQVVSGLSPLVGLRTRLAAVREGRASRVEGTYPSEVEPLVTDLNALLDDRERRVTAALAKAGDLAHGLKTPLAVLAHEADLADAAGHGDLAATIAEQVDRMRRQVEAHLAQARAAASGATPGVTSDVRTSVEGLVRTLARLHRDRGLTMAVEIAGELTARVRREDLDEMIGNLLDNACQWASARIVVTATAASMGVITVWIDDDGPGLAPSMREAVLQRGVRLDEAAPGSGLGLAIVRDLTAAYGGGIAIETSPAGGVRARLTLPGGVR